MSGFNLATFTLQVFSPQVDPWLATPGYRWFLSDKRVLANLPAMMEAAEQDLSDLLPHGYEVRIRPAIEEGGAE